MIINSGVSGPDSGSDTDQAVQPQKIARYLKFRIEEIDMVEGLYFLLLNELSS